MSVAPFARRLPVGRIGGALTLAGLAAFLLPPVGRWLAAATFVPWLLPTGWIVLAARGADSGDPAAIHDPSDPAAANPVNPGLAPRFVLCGSGEFLPTEEYRG